MNSIRNGFCATAVLFAALALPAAAQDDPKTAPAADQDQEKDHNFFDDVGLKTRLRVFDLEGEDHADRFNEYRDFLSSEGGELSSFEIWLKQSENTEYFFRAKVTDAGQRDQEVDLAWGRVGMYQMSLNWNRIPHRFGSDGSSLYRGLGTDTLLISDLIQASLQGSTSGPVSRNRLENFNAGATPIDGDDLMLLRDRLDMGFEWYTWEPLRVGVNFSYEGRDGMRPIFVTFGFGNAAQVTEPIDYTTLGAGVNLTYAEENYNVGVYYDYSSFVNHEQSLTWDNLFRLNDSTNASAYSQSYQNGGTRGRMAFDANNEMHRLALRGGVDLCESTRLSGEVAFSWMESLTHLQPYTTNLAIVPGAVYGPPFIAAHASNLPSPTFLGATDTQFYQLVLTSHLHEQFDAKAYGRYRDHNDRREGMAFPGHARIDGLWDPNGITTHHLDRTQLQAGASFTWRVPDINSVVKPDYEYENMDRQGREVEVTDTQTLGIGIDTDWCPVFSTEGSFSHEWRRSGSYESSEAELPMFRMIDQSDRVRDDYGVGFTVRPCDDFQAGVRFRRQDEAYDVRYGENRITISSAEIDFSATPCEELTLSFLGGVEMYRSGHTNRQWTPNGLGDPDLGFSEVYSFGDHTEDLASNIYTLQFRGVYEPVKDEFKATVNYVFAWNTSGIDFGSGIGGNPSDANNYEPVDIKDAQNSSRHALNLDFDYRLFEEAHLIWGYGFEMYSRTNLYNRGINGNVTVGPNAGNYLGAYILGLTDPAYQVHTFYVGIDLEF